MPHQWLSADQIVMQALGLLQRDIVLPRLVWNASSYFTATRPGRKNDTVNLAVPAVLDARTYEWRTRTQPIVTDELEETTVPILLDTHVYSAVGVTDEEMTLDITQFGEQVTSPQVRGVAERLENMISAKLSTAPWQETIGWNVGTTSAYDTLLDARKMLNDRNVPKNDRIVLIGSGVERAILADDHLHQFEQSGSSDAFREAQIGRIAGFTVMQSNSIAEDAMYVYHRSALAWVQLAPVVPSGVPFGSSRSAYGMAMRWIRDYDAAFLRDRSVFSAFAGVNSVNDGPEIDLDGAGSGTATGASNQRGTKVVVTGL